MKRIVISFFILFLTVNNYSQNTIDQFYVNCSPCSISNPNTDSQKIKFIANKVTSDFGPRQKYSTPESYDFHGGIDFGAPEGSGIVPFKNATIVSIVDDYNSYNGNYLKSIILNSNEIGIFTYRHIFKNQSIPSFPTFQVSGQYEITKYQGYFVIINHGNPLNQDSNPNNNIAFSSSPIVLTFSHNNKTYETKKEVTISEAIAPIGGSGGFPIHLHAHTMSSFNSSSDLNNDIIANNPLQYIPHVSSGYNLEFLNNPSNPNFTVFYGNQLNTIGVNCRMIGSSNGNLYSNSVYDINKMELLIINGINGFDAIKGNDNESIINYGGLSDESNVHPNSMIQGDDGNGNTGRGSWIKTGIDPFAYRDDNGKPYDNYYFTEFIPRISEEDTFSTNLILAKSNEQARYKDGINTIKAVATTINNQIFEKTHNITIDNFLPYIKKVTLSDASGVFYMGEWNLNSMETALEFQYCSTGNNNGDNRQGFDIEVETSETMNALGFEVSDSGVSQSMSLTPDDTKTIWSYSFAGTVNSGEHTLTFYGTDLAGNQLRQMQGDSAHLYYRNGNGSNDWHSETTIQNPLRGSDTRHIFNKPPHLSANCSGQSTCSDNYEPNNDAQDAKFLATIGKCISDNKTFNVKLDVSNNDQDWFYFVPTSSGSLTVTLSATESWRFNLELVDASGTILATAQTVSGDKVINWQYYGSCNANSQKYIKITSNYGSCLDYNLDIAWNSFDECTSTLLRARNITSTINGDTTYCVGETIQLTASGSSYVWYYDGVESGTGTTFTKPNASQGNHTVMLLDNDDPCFTEVVEIQVSTCENTPANDDCSNAETLTSNTYESFTNGTVENATESVGANQCIGCDCRSDDDFDVYYEFTAVESSHTVHLTNYASNFDAVLELRRSCSSGLDNYISCYDPSGTPPTIDKTWNGLSPGQTYYIRVFEFNYGDSPPSSDIFDICVTHNEQIQGADLISNIINVSNSNPDSSDTITVTYSMSNVGDEDAYYASQFAGALYLSTDQNYSSSDIFMSGSTHSLYTINPEQTITVTKSVIIPNVSDGQYYIISNPDIGNDINEIYEDNNFDTYAIQIGNSDDGGCISDSQWPDETLNPLANWQTVENIYAGEYSVYNVTAGQDYIWSTCNEDGVNSSYDTQLTLRRNSNGSFIAYSDDECETDAKISWTANFTGQVRVLINEYDCESNTTDSSVGYKIDNGSTNYTYVPDDNFEQALIDLGYDSGTLDNYVPTSNINSITTLYVSDKNISDLTGIEDFVSLVNFECLSNQLTSIDISQNTNLERLHCADNQLTSIDVSQNLNLKYLYFDQNQLTDIDLSHNYNLLELDCGTNQFTSIDVSQNYNLQDLSCSTNQLTFLDVSQNLDLEDLICLDNQLTSLDLSNNLNLKQFSCTSNLLTELNVKNGNNENITYFKAYNNPYLYCIQVDNEDNANNGIGTYANWDINFQVSYSEDCNNGALTYVPDDNFEQALIDLGYDTGALDNYVPTFNISGIVVLNIMNKNISDLTGIEDFNSLLALDCAVNNLTNIDVSNNDSLQYLRCNNNFLTNIDVSNNLELIELAVYSNQISTIDVSLNVNLQKLECSNNQLTNLNVNNNNNLILLGYALNQITHIDLSNNPLLETLFSSYNQLSELDLSYNSQLSIFNCYNNQLTALDLSNNASLSQLICNNNQLQSLNLKNGNNSILLALDATNNTNLNCIQVDDEVSANNGIGAYANWNIDSWTSYSEICNVPQTYVPDDNFEQALIDLGYDSGALNDYVPTNNIDEIIDLEIHYHYISDLTGIEDFELLENLQVSDNLLTSIDISQNANLKQLGCSNNLLTSIDISENQTLESLYIAHNQLTELNTTGNLNLEYLSCHHNNISSLDVIHNTLLKSLDFQYNNLTSINIQQNVLLEYFNAQENSLISVDFSQNSLLETIIIPYNNLTSLNVTNQNQLNKLWAQYNNISNIDLSNNSLLQVLYISNNNLSQLNIQENINLYHLSCSNNEITNITFGNNFLLQELHCMNNNIINFNISNLTDIKRISCSNNQITSIDIHLNNLLTRLSCSNNNLSYLNVNNGNNQNMLTMSSHNNPSLICIQVDNEIEANNGVGAYADWVKDATASYSEACNVPQTYVPDDNFEQALIDLGYDSGALDDYVPTNNINDIDNLDINDLEIVDLTGIEDFTALRFLNCQNNQIQELDISNNLNLRSLYIWNNQLTSLDVSNNSQLISLSVFQNQLTSIDVTNNTSLRYLEYANNQISGIDLTQNTVLKRLDCEYNQMTSLNISENTLLEYIICGNNLLTSIDVSLQPNLKQLVMENNQITVLDISNNHLIEYLYANDNRLTSINVNQNDDLEILSFDNNELTSFDATQIPLITRFHCQNNNLISLDISTNIYLQRLLCNDNQLESLNLKNGYNATTLAKVNCYNNPNLTCIQVDNEIDSYNQPCTANPYVGWCKDTTAYYSETCDMPMTYVPDDNFEQVLINNGYDDVLDDYVLTANIINVEILNMNYKNISDLTGIQDFTNLKNLSCAVNQLSMLNITNNVLLESLDCDSNQLTSLDISNNPNLVWIDCKDNNLSSLDVSIHTNLETLNISQNQISNINISQNTSLSYFYCADNLLTSIDVSNCTNLSNLSCSNNQIQYLNTNFLNTNLTSLKCSGNQLVSLDVSQNQNLQNLRCSDNQLSSIDLSNNNNDLLCIQVDDEVSANNSTGTYANWVTDYWTSYSENCNMPMTYVPDDNFEQALIDLGYDSGTLDDYVPTNNIDIITELVINSLGISDLTGIEDFIALESLSCYENNLSTLDISQNVDLNYLDCENNQLVILDISQNNELQELHCEHNQLSNLDISQNNHLMYLSCVGNQLETIYSSYNPNLYNVDCSYNQLTTFDTSQFPNLSGLFLTSNRLINLDISQNTEMIRVFCDINMLTSLNIKNDNNSILEMMVASENPNLNCIQVDNVDYANSRNLCNPGSWCKHNTAIYSIDCNASGDSDITLYPNPTNDIIYINNPFNTSITQVTVANSLGQIIMTITDVESEIDISNLNNGIYYITLQDSEGGLVTIVIVKQ